MASIRSLLIAGRNVAVGGVSDGPWNGPGLTSSTAANYFFTDKTENHVVGYALNSALPLGAYSTFGGMAVTSTDILVRYTVNGDANLDGVCNATDQSILNSFNDGGATTGHQWYQGDFNWDGKVDSKDLQILTQFSGTTTAAAVAPVAVPEPGLGILVLAIPLVARRRRCRSVREMMGT
jgi:hypothetical protein